MKAKDKNAKPDPNRQKKQLLMLGSLVVMLGIVIAVQFGGSEPEATAEALAAPPEDPAAVAQVLATDPAAAAAALGTEPAPAPAAPAPAPVASGSGVADNPVLSEPATVEGEGLLRSPFANFWSVATPAATSGEVVEIAPPSIVLNATLPSSHRALAVIDGEMHFVGDQVQGWELAEVLERRIVLRSPSQTTVTIEMPVLVGARAIPATLASPASLAAPVPTDG